MSLPFPGSATDTANATLIFSIAAALLYLIMLDAPQAFRRMVVKTFAVALLAVLAFVQGGPVLLVVALALSAVGDAFLARDGDKAFLAGLGSFLAAHLVYVALFWPPGGSAGILVAQPWRAVAAAAMVAFALFMLSRLLRVVASDMRLPIVLYVAAIVAMGIAALTLGNLFIIAGAVAFMASDAMLASEKFLMAEQAPGSRPARIAVWVLYYAAQLSITLGFLLGAPIFT
ncbi:MAG: lysoplasmalogenase [Mesorhizobium sp.]